MRRAGLVFSMAALLFAMMPSVVTHGQGGGADFTRFVGVGDSLTAGFRDGALHASAQETGFYALLAQSMGTQVAIPLIAEPGIPTPDAATGAGLLLQIPGTCQVGATTFATGQTTGRIDPTTPATDVAVPGQDIGDALTVKWNIDPANIPGTTDTAEDFVLGFPYVLAPPPANTPHSQIEEAVGLQPTFVSFWLGSNDALAAALAGTVDDTTLTPVATFNANADAAAAAIVSTGAKVVMFNVPDVTVIPNLFSEKDVEQLSGLTASQVKLLFGLKKTDYVPLTTLPTLQKIASGQQPPRSLTPDQVLTKKEIKQIRKAIKAYNKKLKSIADANGWAFVDVNATLTDYDKNGVTITGVGTLTTAYLGGLFGLDGVHPSATGHALIAQMAVAAINSKYGTSLQPPDVAAIAATDPEVCMTGSAKAATLDDLVQYAPAARAAANVILHRGAN
jgi:lysophospholipase L1-like esterase